MLIAHHRKTNYIERVPANFITWKSTVPPTQSYKHTLHGHAQKKSYKAELFNIEPVGPVDWQLLPELRFSSLSDQALFANSLAWASKVLVF